jgi:hypothetical protein
VPRKGINIVAGNFPRGGKRRDAGPQLGKKHSNTANAAYFLIAHVKDRRSFGYGIFKDVARQFCRDFRLFKPIVALIAAFIDDVQRFYETALRFNRKPMPADFRGFRQGIRLPFDLRQVAFLLFQAEKREFREIRVAAPGTDASTDQCRRPV